MESNVQALKHYIYELEYALSAEEYERAKNVSRKIKEHTEKVDRMIDLVTDCATGIYYNNINRLEFLYKPVEVADPFKGNYFERFAKERAADLIQAGAKEGHDEFWSEHNVLKANVYGLVPVDLISEASADSLIRAGWVRVEVDVLDFGKVDNELKDIYRYCEDSFEHYITLKEEQTDSTLVLKFAS